MHFMNVVTVTGQVNFLCDTSYCTETKRIYIDLTFINFGFHKKRM